MIRLPKNKRWSELSNPQRGGIVVMAIVQIGLLIAALVDLRRRPADEIKGSKRMWLGLVFINYVGPIAYFVLGRKHNH